MGSTGTVRLQAIWDMLAHCAEGFRKEAKTHHWVVYFGDDHCLLPLGPHGKRQARTVDIEIGHVKRMVRTFGIQDCAKGQLPQL
jgi:hypothetical protein